jgi:hypothetical protein
MTPHVPICRHLDLYGYWLSKRNGRIIPARRDMDPVELGTLLPFLFIIDKVTGEFRFRLMGTSVIRDLGRDLTGKPLSAYAPNSPQPIAAVQALLERVFANAQPVLVTGQFPTGHGTMHNSSCLLLPLSDDGRCVNMVIATCTACFNGNIRPSQNWLEWPRLKLGVIDIHDAADLERRCLEWRGVCLANERP